MNQNIYMYKTFNSKLTPNPTNPIHYQPHTHTQPQLHTRPHPS